LVGSLQILVGGQDQRNGFHHRLLVRLDALEVYGLAPDFYVALERYIGAKTALMAHLDQPAVILRQLSRREPAV
jgi:hypothetical protein